MLLLRQNDVATSFWRNDDIITLCVRWVWISNRLNCYGIQYLAIGLLLLCMCQYSISSHVLIISVDTQKYIFILEVYLYIQYMIYIFLLYIHTYIYIYWPSSGIFGLGTWNQHGKRLNITMSSYLYRDSHYKDKTISWPSYLYNGNHHIIYTESVP